jgi:hypothetical protein
MQDYNCKFQENGSLQRGRISVEDNTSNKKFWEELIAYIPFAVISVCHTTCTKKTFVYVRNKANKTVQFGRL